MATKLERMTIVFPQPMAAEVRAAVEAGEYASTSEAVRDAVRLWTGHRQAHEDERERLRRAWDAGKVGGLYGTVDFKALRKDARRRLAAAKVDAGNAD